MKVAAKIKRKYIQKDNRAVMNIQVHLLQDLNIKAGDFISICPTDLESINIEEVPVPEPPYWVR